MLKILTWNILSLEFIKDIYYPDINKNSLYNKNRIKIIIKKLKNYNADIILLQEVMENEYLQLLNIFKNNYYIIKGEKLYWNNKESFSFNITLLNKKKIEYNNEIINLDFGFIINIKHNYNYIYIIANIHLNNYNYNIRLNQINSLLNIIKKNEHNKIIIGGDFNQEYNYNSKLYNILINNNYKIHNKNQITYYIEKNMIIDNILTKNINLKNLKNSKDLKDSNDSKNSNDSKDSKLLLNKLYDKDDIFKKYGSDHLPFITYV